jgi:DNA-binding NarL/FixJ family response regulator
VDYTPFLSDVRGYFAAGNQLLDKQRLVVCTGSRLALTLFINAYQSGPQIVGAGTRQSEALRQLESKPAGLLVCTDHLEQGNGGSLVAAAKELNPALQTLMIVTQPRRMMAIRTALEAGCNGLCLESQIGHGTVMRALMAVSCGAAYTEQVLHEQYFQSYAGLEDAPIARLTDREVEVLQLVAANASNAEIAATLFISPETVKSHVRQIMHKLPAQSRLHAAVKGIRLGLVEWPEDR